MIDILLKTLDRIIDLLRIREKRIQKRFDQIWKPTYSDLQSVHADYYSMFAEVYSIARSGKKKGKDIFADRLHKAIEFIKQKRIAFSPIRQKLEALLQIQMDEKLLILLGKEEQHFLSQVTRYIQIKSLADFEGTRSANLQVELERMARMDQTVAERFILEELPKRIEHLGDDWIEVTKSFNALQMALIQRST
jgi:hypothetical protein